MNGLEALSPKQRATAQRVIAEAKAQGVPPNLAYGMAMQESGFDQSKKSKTGPTGVMMLGKAAAKDMNVNRHNEMENIRGGVAYMKQMLDKYNGDVDKALIAYHDGPNSPYFTSGQASPAAINHIQKVKGYAGMPVSTTPAAAPVSAAGPSKSGFSVTLEDVEPLDISGLSGTTAPAQGFGRPRDMSDVVMGGAGAMAGYAFGPDKPMSKKRMDQMRIQIAADRAANEARAQAAAANKPMQFGTGKDAWIANQHDPLLAQPLFGQPSQAAAGAAEPAARAQLQKAQSLFPNMAPASAESLIALPNTVGQGNKILPTTATTAAPTGGLPATTKPINFGSVPGRAANTIAGGMTLAQANDMAQRAAQGDYVGSGLAGVSGLGAAATFAPNPKAKLLGAATSAGAAGLQYLYDLFKTDDQTKSVLQPEGEAPKYKKGGAVKKSDGGLPAVEHFDGGGRIGAGKAAWQLGSQQMGKLSDWAQNYIGHYFVPTQADRMGGVGGPSYSANSLARPEYSGRVWGSGKPSTATAISNLATDPRYGGAQRQIFAPLLGSENMHQSNQMVYDKLLQEFYKNKHNLTPEKIAEINQYMQTGGLSSGITKPKFDPIAGFDILDQNMLKKYGDTFDTRKAIANHAFGNEGMGKSKGRIFDYQNILNEMSDPLTQGAPSFSMGPRAFRLTGETEQAARHDLNPAYPYQLHGEDLGVTYQPVPSELALRDFQKQWRQDTGKTMPKKSGALPQPGYYEHTLGYTPEGASERVYPRQLISEEWIKDLQSSAFAEGGQVQHFDAGGKVGGLARLAESAYDILKLTPEKVDAWRKLNAKPFKQQQDPQLAQALEAYMTGKISQADYLRIMNERRPIRPLTEVPTAHSNIDIVSALDKNKADKGILGLNLQVPEGMRVGNRLDIPAYERYGVYVDTMHDPAGKPIGYGHTGHLKDVEFQSDPNKAVRVGLGTREQALTPLAVEEGSGKGPFAMMVGNQQTTKDEEVRRMLAEALQDPSWTQIGMNPYRGSQFYDKADMQPVWSAAEKIQAGPLVLARDVEKTSWQDPRLKTKYGVNYAAGGLTHL
jgi:Transglycosylase SLT domain